jgi:hypothetical protein
VYTVRVYSDGQHRFYDDLFNMLVSYIVFGSVAEAFRGGSPTFDGIDIGLEGNVMSYDLFVTPSSLILPMLEDRRPATIELKQRGRAQNDYAPGVKVRREPRRVLATVVGASFVRYYESVEDFIKAAHGTDRSQWPEKLRFGNVVRNAFAHDGTVVIRNPNARPVWWRSLSYNYADNGRRILYSDLAVADLIFLMDEMDALF